MSASTNPNQAPGEKSVTLAEQAYLNLKKDIMAGALAPGQPLRLEFLKQRYHLSFSPLREALNRLQSERLVDAFALKGFRVSPLSPKEMWDAINARTLIDCEALRRSIAAGPDDWEARIVAALHALDRATGKKVAAEELQAHHDLVEQRHLALHRALIDACDSRWLLDFSMTLYVQTERYRRPMLLNLPKSATPRDVSREHHEIVAATLERDAAQACELLAQHYARTARMIEESLGDANAPQQ
jgi:DNA-binding GntR family transcriptional regulator